MSDIKNPEAYQAKMRRGTLQIGGLLTLITIVEYYLATHLHGQWMMLLAAMLLMAVAKAWFIVRDFMHVSQLWGRGDH